MFFEELRGLMAYRILAQTLVGYGLLSPSGAEAWFSKKTNPIYRDQVMYESPLTCSTYSRFPTGILALVHRRQAIAIST